MSLLVPAVLGGYVFSSRGYVIPFFLLYLLAVLCYFLGNVLFSVVNLFFLPSLPSPPVFYSF